MKKKKNRLRTSGIGEDSFSNSGELFNLENKLLSVNTAVKIIIALSAEYGP